MALILVTLVHYVSYSRMSRMSWLTVIIRSQCHVSNTWWACVCLPIFQVSWKTPSSLKWNVGLFLCLGLIFTDPSRKRSFSKTHFSVDRKNLKTSAFRSVYRRETFWNANLWFPCARPQTRPDRNIKFSYLEKMYCFLLILRWRTLKLFGYFLQASLLCVRHIVWKLLKNHVAQTNLLPHSTRTWEK